MLLGPAFGSEFAISQARVLNTADPSVQTVLAADVVTNRLLKAALKGGIIDVLDTPLSEEDLSAVLRLVPRQQRAPTEIQFAIEPVSEVIHPDLSDSAEVGPSLPADVRVGVVQDANVPSNSPDTPVPMTQAAEVRLIVEIAQAGDIARTRSPTFLRSPPTVSTRCPDLTECSRRRRA